MANLSELLAELQNDHNVPEERACEIAAEFIAIGVRAAPERPETLDACIGRMRDKLLQATEGSA